MTGVQTCALPISSACDQATAALTTLTSLDLDGYPSELGLSITDVSPLASLTNLTMLDLSSNGIVDIAPLTSLTRLMQLDLGSNDITDVTALAHLPQLMELEIGRAHV